MPRVQIDVEAVALIFLCLLALGLALLPWVAAFLEVHCGVRI